jgi:hypothetical protein
LDIKQAMRAIEAASCVKFVKRRNEDNYVTFKSDQGAAGKGCSSRVGMSGGQQFINLVGGDLSQAQQKENTIRMLFNTLGFRNMQRQQQLPSNNYIKFVSQGQNTNNGKQSNFRARSNVGAQSNFIAQQFSNFLSRQSIPQSSHQSSYQFQSFTQTENHNDESDVSKSKEDDDDDDGDDDDDSDEDKSDDDDDDYNDDGDESDKESDE